MDNEKFDIRKELERIQELANNIWFFADRILTHPAMIREVSFESGALISELQLSSRAINCLMRVGIRYVEQLAKLTDNDLLKLRNMGTKTLSEIRSKTPRL